MLNKTKIICTIGQQCENENVLEEMLLSGMNVARLNLSNGGITTQRTYINTIKKLSLIHDRALSIMLDTYGPKIKAHEFSNSIERMAKGCKVTIHTQNEITGNEYAFSVNYPGLFDDVSLEDEILVNGSVHLLVIHKNEENKTIECEVIKSGTAQDNCLVNVPSIQTSMPCINDEDAAVLKFATKAGVDFIGASFVRNAKDVLEIKEAVGPAIKVFAKIENKSAVDNFEEILEVADGIIISRGDLSVEVPYEIQPIIQKKMIRKANKVGKPIVVSTQILSSMTRNKKPSRAEVSDLANLVLDGVDAISLTNVTSLGLYPVKAVKETAKIIKATEEHALEVLSKDRIFGMSCRKSCNDNGEFPLDDAVANAVITTARDVNAKLIVAFSESGATAKRISKHRPNCPIASVSSDDSIRMSLTLNWGIYPVVASHKTYEIDFLSLGREIAVYYGLKEGDTFIITGGNGIGNTNLMKVCRV